MALASCGRLGLQRRVLGGDVALIEAVIESAELVPLLLGQRHLLWVLCACTHAYVCDAVRCVCARAHCTVEMGKGMWAYEEMNLTYSAVAPWCYMPG